VKSDTAASKSTPRQRHRNHPPSDTKSETSNTPRVKRKQGRYGKDSKQRQFLKAFVRLGTVSGGADAVGVHRSAVTRWRERDPEFAQAFEVAQEQFADRLEGAVLQRVIEGEFEYIPNPKTGIVRDEKGVPIMQRRSNAQRDLAVLRAHKPRYREESKLEIGGQVTFSKPEVNVTLIKEVMAVMINIPPPPMIDDAEEDSAPQLPEPRSLIASIPPIQLDVIEGEAREIEPQADDQ
jgi:hypothetical protein